MCWNCLQISPQPKTLSDMTPTQTIREELEHILRGTTEEFTDTKAKNALAATADLERQQEQLATRLSDEVRGLSVEQVMEAVDDWLWNMGDKSAIRHPLGSPYRTDQAAQDRLRARLESLTPIPMTTELQRLLHDLSRMINDERVAHVLESEDYEPLVAKVEACIAIASLPVEGDRWISVDIPPKAYRWFLVYSDTGDVGDFPFDIGRIIGGKWQCLGWDYPVTHYRELPSPPKPTANTDQR